MIENGSIMQVENVRRIRMMRVKEECIEAIEEVRFNGEGRNGCNGNAAIPKNHVAV